MCVFVCLCERGSSIALLCTQRKRGSELIFHNSSWKRSLNKANVCDWESPGISFNIIHAIVQWCGSKWEYYVVLWTGAQVVEYTGIRLAFCLIKMSRGKKKKGFNFLVFLLKMAFSLSIIVEHSGIGLLPHDSLCPCIRV